MKKVALILLFSIAALGEVLETPPHAAGPRDPLNRLQLSPTVAIVVPSDLVLSSNRYEVTYANKFLGLSSFYVGLSKHLDRIGDFELFATGRMGYGFNQGKYQLESFRQMSTGNVELHWIPIQMGTRAEYSIPGLPFLRPSLTLSGGGYWLHQRGDIAEGNDNFWIPYLSVTPAVTFFNGVQDHDWFGGFTFGISYLHSIATSQKVETLAYELSGHILF